MKKLSCAAILFIVFLLASSQSFAQTSFTRLSGTVKDASGGVVPGVTMTLTRVDTGATSETFTNDEGAYLFGTINPGIYELKAEMDGFKAVTYHDIRLVIQSSHRQDIVLETGEITDEITVTASTEVVLQKSDATVGNVIESERLLKLPNASRSTITLFSLQPGTAPDGTGTTVTGSRRDQQTFQLDGIDVSDNVVGATETVIPTPTESVEEFRVAVANPDASFGRSAGANVTLVTKRGGNQFHGSAYWYHQNDALNATPWGNNRRGSPKAELKDNRFGFSIGGPILKDKTFFFGNYEGRRLPGSAAITRIVPTQSMRDGFLRFRDDAGVVQTIDPLDFDLRGLGSNPAILSVFRQLPLPNASGGDGLNTGGFQSDVGTNLESEYGVIRVDHHLADGWNLEAKFAASRVLQNSASQVDLINLLGTTNNPRRTRNAHIGLNTTFTPTLTNEFRFGWVKDNRPLTRNRPTGELPWLDPSMNIAVNIGLQNIDEPTDVDTQRGRIQTSNSDYFQFVDNQTWIKGNHVFQYGVDVRFINFIHFRDDKVIGSIGLPVAEIGNLQFTTILPAERPSFIQPDDISRYDQFFASQLGIISNVPYMAVRDGNLEPLPVGSSLEADTSQNYYSFYFLDTWRLAPSLSVNYGLYYGWTTAPIEAEGKQTIGAFADNPSQFLTAENYLIPKNLNTIGGSIFNPDVAFVPINDSGQNAAYDTDYRNLSPRAAVAWNPSFQDGFLGKVFGDGKSVFRGGYSLLWDRTNTVQTVIIPTLGIGFAQTISVNAPLNPAGEFQRVGVDGPIPVAGFGAATSPIVPDPIFSEILSFSVDPAIKVPYNHVFDFTIQRELPKNHVLELGYIGRAGRDLYQSLNLQQTPLFAVDPISGQSFAQAFDAVAGELRADVAPADVTPQPFFDNALAGTGLNTALLAAASEVNFINGNLNNLFQTIDIQRFVNGLESYNNLQSLDLFIRTSGGRSNYHGFVMSLRKNFSNGLVYDFNYTIAKSLDQNGAWQNSAGQVPNSFNLDAGYGPSNFDLTHIANINWVYELPFGANRRFSASGFLDKLIGGWFTSGIVSMRSGQPLLMSQGGQVWGGGAVFGNAVGGIPTTDVSKFGNDVNSGVTGSNGVGTNADPGSGGTGLGLFSNPEQVFNSFRRIRISEDTRDGRGALRAPWRWDLDLSVGKRTSLATIADQEVTMTFSFDFINALNNVQFANPNLSFTNAAAFGAFTGTDNAHSPRTIQFGMRIDF